MRSTPSAPLIDTDVRRTATAIGFLRVVGLTLVVSGAAHTGVWLADGGPWEGPVSWRKPIVFGFSVGVTLLSIAWVVSRSGPRRRPGRLALWVFGVASAFEVGLITMQRWRGTASHFNDATPFDRTVFALMGIAVALMFAGIVVVTVWSFRRLDTSRAMAGAIRIGLVALVVGNVVGTANIVLGPQASSALKLPHFLALHAIQLLPALVWGRSRLAGRLRPAVG